MRYLSTVFAATVCAMLLWPVGAGSQTTDAAYVKQLHSAVGLLYSIDSSGGYRMHCTATIFEKSPKGYLFVTAAHCIGTDDRTKETSASVETSYYITFDEHDNKVFWPAEVKWVGYQTRGEDLMVIEVASTAVWPVIRLGDESKEIPPAPYWNIASPLGLGKQAFEGNITSLDLDRPVKQGDINWQHSLVLQQSGVGGGSSGSALVSKSQRAIVGLLVGTIGDSTIIAIPISRFKAVDAAVKAGKYRWYKPKEVIEPLK